MIWVLVYVQYSTVDTIRSKQTNICGNACVYVRTLCSKVWDEMMGAWGGFEGRMGVCVYVCMGVVGTNENADCETGRVGG